MTGAQENGEQPILNIEGDLVALGPLRRDLLPLYTRWINDLAAVRTLGAFLPTTIEGETKWYDEWATSEKTVPFTVYARPEPRHIGTASHFEVELQRQDPDFEHYRIDGEGDRVYRHRLPDGREFDVIKNSPTERQLRAAGAGIALP